MLGPAAGADLDAQGDELIRRAMNGDEAAFALVFRTLQPPLMRYLRGRFGGAVEDIAAETWAAVAKDLHRFRGDFGDFRAWMFTIARARGLDEARRRPLRPVPAAELPETRLHPSAETSALDRIEERDVLALVRLLPTDQADAVLARVVAGLDVAAAAAMLNKSPVAVRVNTHRGLRRLASLLDPPSRKAAAR
jgi:RNA polymerase sigma-70 factor (ECF subfamily)